MTMPGRRRGAARPTSPTGIRLRFDRIIPLCLCAAAWAAIIITVRIL